MLVNIRFAEKQDTHILQNSLHEQHLKRALYIPFNSSHQRSHSPNYTKLRAFKNCVVVVVKKTISSRRCRNNKEKPHNIFKSFIFIRAETKKTRTSRIHLKI